MKTAEVIKRQIALLEEVDLLALKIKRVKKATHNIK